MDEWPKIAFKLPLLSLACALALKSGAAPIAAELKLQGDFGFAHDSDDAHGQSIDNFQLIHTSLRLKAGHSAGAWSWEAQALLSGDYSPDLATLRAVPYPAPALPLGDFTTVIADRQKGYADLRLDRAVLNYTLGPTTVKIGRQALTWGNGKLFNPMDRFAPFSPRAEDTSYKPGSDMLYLQHLFDSGADLQIIALPRRDPATHQVRRDLSSLAAKYLFNRGAWQFELLAAEDWDDTIAGASMVAPVGSALWSTDFVFSRLAEGGNGVALTTNLQQAWTWGSRPMSGFAEYAHNSLGLTGPAGPAGLPATLVTRLARGQIFNLGCDYFALGLSADWTPLVKVAPSLILNLHDGSGILLVDVSWNASQRDTLIFGLQAPFGSATSEYGASSNPIQLYLRWEKYF